MSLPVSVVIITWNSANVIAECLASLEGQGCSDIHVIDNGSTDATLDIISRAKLPVQIHQEALNVGFSQASNIGIAKSTNPYLFLLNDDARLAPGYLATLTQQLEAAPKAATAVGKMVYQHLGKQYIDSAGINLGKYALCPLDIGHGCLDEAQFDEPCELFGPSATATLYRRSALSALGEKAFDESFFAYYEDVDLAWRLGLAGYTHLYVPEAVVEHCRRGPDEKPAHIRAQAFANRYLLFAKNESLGGFLLYAPIALPWEVVRIMKRVVTDPAILSRVPRALTQVLEILVERARKSG